MHAPTRHLVAAFVGIGLIVLIWLIPDLTPARAQDDVVAAYRGRIESIDFSSSDQDGDLPAVPMAQVQLLDGPLTGQVIDAYLAGPGGSQDTSTYAAGQEVVVTYTAQADGSEPYVEVSDHWRLPGLAILAAIFAAAVVFVGGWHGARALVALGLTAVVILKILIPAIIAGVPPVPLAVLVASSITIVTILLTEGWSRTSLAAILGTTGALAITALLAAVATAFLGFTYTAGSDLAFLAIPGGQGLDLRGILLAAIILGSVGVLDDVTVTQSVLVEELADKGDLRGPALVVSAMRIGRSHIAATVNTLFLAYVSVGLPLLVVLFVSRLPSTSLLNDETIATEIVRTLIGSLGIIAAIPLTTFIAGPLLERRSNESRAWAAGGPGRLPRVFVAIAVIIGLLSVTVAVSLSSTTRPPLAPDVFEPGAMPLFDPATESTEPDIPVEPPDTYDPGTAIPIILDGRSIGTVAVTGRIDPADPPLTTSRAFVQVTYSATRRFPLSIGRWELLLDDGSEIPLTAVDGPSTLDRTLKAGETAQVDLTAALGTEPTDAFVVFVDVASSRMALAIPIS